MEKGKWDEEKERGFIRKLRGEGEEEGGGETSTDSSRVIGFQVGGEEGRGEKSLSLSLSLSGGAAQGSEEEKEIF